MSELKRNKEWSWQQEYLEQKRKVAELTAHVERLKGANKSMLQELIECSYELQCLCGHPACKSCQRYGQLAEFIEEMKTAI